MIRINATTDRLFTNHLGDHLIGNNATFVATCRLNKHFIPEICKKFKQLHGKVVV